MQMVKLVTKEEDMIVVCSMQLPTQKVYEEFDLVTILSKGQEAYTGEGIHAKEYFAKNGLHCPPNTSLPEFLLDKLSPEAEGDEAIDTILGEWKNQKVDPNRKSFYMLNSLNESEDGRNGVRNRPPTSLGREILSMLHRHSTLISRDRITYSGRGVIYFVVNILLAIVYWNARPAEQDQLFSKVYLAMWFAGFPSSRK